MGAEIEAADRKMQPALGMERPEIARSGRVSFEGRPTGPSKTI